MIKSMTGYGRSTQTINGHDITVEIKSINHRYLEFSARTPRSYGYLDEKLKSTIQREVSRGKVEVTVGIITTDETEAHLAINYQLLTSYVESLREAGEKLALTDDLSLSGLLRLNDIFHVEKLVEDEQIIWEAVKIVTEQAMENFKAMRALEGERLNQDIASRLEQIKIAVQQIEQLSPKTVADYQAKLYAKITELLADRQIEEQRLITEVAIFSEKIAVDEETVRLNSHLNQFEDILSSQEPMGRKLDFLVQEINREVNTIGSKAQNVEIAKIVVNVKSEIEKIREQIQNIE